MKVYISGKITGIEEQAFGLFECAETLLIKKGHKPVNPMKLSHKHNKSYNSYMRDCLKALLRCDAIYMLDNWETSKGALIEYDVAKKLDYTIFHQL